MQHESLSSTVHSLDEPTAGIKETGCRPAYHPDARAFVLRGCKCLFQGPQGVREPSYAIEIATYIQGSSVFPSLLFRGHHL